MSIYIFFKQQESTISLFIYAIAYYCFYYFVFVNSIFNQNKLNKAMYFIYFIKASLRPLSSVRILIFLFAGDDFLTDSYNSSD